MPDADRAGILLAEDTNDMRYLLAAAFENSRFHVVAVAEDGDEALELWQARRDEIDAVALDHRMPSIDGLEVARRIREVDADIPIVLFSAELTRELTAEASALAIGVMDKDRILSLPEHPTLRAV